ncbi:hypothetical protein SSX86_029911 [Deinandra increscens subsp. villosa]|uniref:SWIM-type domain-containing protein n=1 Tax=Deinandra increscens subsp. villosa TaxID=3103831 RepID=A0AAP0GKJ0_9ASTR
MSLKERLPSFRKCFCHVDFHRKEKMNERKSDSAYVELFGCVYLGTSGHFYHILLDKLCKGKKDSTTVTKKVVVDQLTASPSNNLMFMLYYGFVIEEMSNQELIQAGNKTMDETDQAIEHSKKVANQTVEVRTQIAAKLKGQTDQMALILNKLDTIQFSIKKASQLVKEIGHQVMFQKEDVTVSCSCLRSEQYGLLCRHIFHALRFSDVLEFPKQYILRRWSREVVPNVINRPMVGVNGVPDSDFQVDAVVRVIIFSAEYVVNKLVKDMEKLCSFRDHLKEYMSTVDAT